MESGVALRGWVHIQLVGMHHRVPQGTQKRESPEKSRHGQEECVVLSSMEENYYNVFYDLINDRSNHIIWSPTWGAICRWGTICRQSLWAGMPVSSVLPASSQITTQIFIISYKCLTDNSCLLLTSLQLKSTHIPYLCCTLWWYLFSSPLHLAGSSTLFHPHTSTRLSIGYLAFY